MNKLKHLYKKYHIDHILAAAWIMMLLIEYFLVKYYSIETLWLPFTAVCLWLICTLRAAGIKKEKKHVPTWYVMASVPGTLMTLSWIEYLFRTEITDMMSRGLILEGAAAVIVRIATILPFIGFIFSCLWVIILASRALDFLFDNILEESLNLDN